MEITFLYRSGLEYNLLLASIINAVVDIRAGFFYANKLLGSNYTLSAFRAQN